jgi:hypothetical protein
MRIQVLTVLSACALALGLAGTASADDYAGKSYFESYDQNHDGVVSKDELGPKQQEYMSKYDEDNNGELSKSEFSAYEKSKDWMSPVTGPGGVHITEPYEPERQE